MPEAWVAGIMNEGGISLFVALATGLSVNCGVSRGDFSHWNLLSRASLQSSKGTNNLL